MKRRKSKWVIASFAAMLLCVGCGRQEDTEEPAGRVENPVIQESVSTGADTQAGEDPDAVPETNAADDTWYRSASVYADENGRRLEVSFDDEGTLQFSVDGISLYNTMADDFQTENDWRIYTCDEGTTVIYYPGTPAHLEISDGEYAGIYEAQDGE